MKFLWLILAGAAVAFWPVQFPVLHHEPEADFAESFGVTGDEPVSFVVTVPDSVHVLSGVTLWTDPQLPVLLNTELIISLDRDGDDPPFVVSRVVLGDVLTYQQLVFRWKPVGVRPGERVTFSVAAPALEEDAAVPVRYEIHDDSVEPSAAVLLYTRTPFLRALLVRLFDYDTAGQDIFYTWQEGRHILEGRNPYTAVTDMGDYWDNHKYATYFPLFYWLSAGSQWLGLTEYKEWIAFWQPVLLVFALLIASLLFVTLYRRGQPVLAGAAVLFFLLNRWSLYVARVAHIDFLALFFLLASFLLFDRRRTLSLVLLSVSLAIKQMAVFVVPLYVLWLWHAFDGDAERLRRVLWSLLIVASVPFIAAFPFLWDNPAGVVLSVLVSASRVPAGDIPAVSLDAFLGLVGVSSRAFLFGLMVLVYLATYYRRLSRAGAVLFVFMIFTGFNTVIYPQYFVWALPFVPLVVSDWFIRERLAVA